MNLKQITTSELNNDIVIRSNNISFNILLQSFNLINAFSLFLLIFVSIAIMLKSIIVVIVVIGIGLFIALVSTYFKQKQKQNTKYINITEIKLLNEIFNYTKSVKEILLNQFFKTYIDSFRVYLTSQKLRLSYNNSYNLIPKLSFDFITTILIFLIILNSYNQTNSDIFENLSTIGFFVLAIQRLSPYFNGFFTAYQNIYANLFHVKKINEIIYDLKDQEICNKSEKIIFKNSIQFKDISFEYVNKFKILNKLNFKINKGDIVGIKGETGNGKSTLIEILMGVLKQSSGKIYVDSAEKNIYYNKSWFGKIAFVPQKVTLINDTILNNIVYTSNKKNVKNKISNIWSILKILELDVLVNSLDEKLNHIISEDGKNFSGGQQQRFGIARALYNSSEILIMDESTSALDFRTEQKILDNILKNYPSSTIIMIAHKKSTLKNCNYIIDLN